MHFLRFSNNFYCLSQFFYFALVDNISTLNHNKHRSLFSSHLILENECSFRYYKNEFYTLCLSICGKAVLFKLIYDISQQSNTVFHVSFLYHLKFMLQYFLSINITIIT